MRQPDLYDLWTWKTTVAVVVFFMTSVGLWEVAKFCAKGCIKFFKKKEKDPREEWGPKK